MCSFNIANDQLGFSKLIFSQSITSNIKRFVKNKIKIKIRHDYSLLISPRFSFMYTAPHFHIACIRAYHSVQHKKRKKEIHSSLATKWRIPTHFSNDHILHYLFNGVSHISAAQTWILTNNLAKSLTYF